MRFYLFIFIVSMTMACNNAANNANKIVVSNSNKPVANNTETAKAPEYSYEIVKTFNHDPKAFNTLSLLASISVIYRRWHVMRVLP